MSRGGCLGGAGPLIAALVASLALGVLTTAAEAHAVLLRVIPSANQQLQSAPAEVRLLFSEPVDPRFSSVAVVDANGATVDNRDSHVEADDDRQVVATLKPNLPNGAYTVRWRSMSVIDIHPDSGEYRLFVGVPPTQTNQQLAGTRSVSTPVLSIARWLLYLAASVFAGAVATWKLVLGPALGDSPARATVYRRVVWFALAGGVLLIVSTLLTAVAQAAAAGNATAGGDLVRSLADLLTRGRFASIWWPRLALSSICVVLVWINGLDSVGGDCALAMQPAILLTSSLTSHGAALPSLTLVGIIVDWLHVTSAVTWVGGLATLGLALTGPLLRATSADADLPRRVVRRFTRLALAAAVLVGVSGIAQAALEVGSFALLLTTGYGNGVLAKVVLLLGMLGLAFRNQRALGLRLVRGVRAELVLGAATLAVAAVLVGTPPARELAGSNSGAASGIIAAAEREP